MAHKVTRRTFLKTASTVAAGIAMPPFVRNAFATKPVSLFLGYPQTGPYASTAPFFKRGMELAIKNFGGTVLDRPIEIIERNVPDPATGVRCAQEVVEKLGCKLLTVTPSSPTVLAVSKYAHKAGALLMAQGGSDKITGQGCNRSTFRWVIPPWGAVRAVVPLVMGQYQAKTFYTITPKYIFGEDLLRNTREVLAQRNGKLLGNAYHAIGETNFSSHIASAKASGADCVLLLNFNNETVNFLKQAHQSELTSSARIACVWGAGIQQFRKLDHNVMEGVFWGLQYYYTIPTEANRLFVKTFKEKYGEIPSYLSATVYATTSGLLHAVRRAGSDAPSRVIKALEGHKYYGLTGREEYRSCDHQCVKPFYVARCKPVATMKNSEDFADIVGHSINLQPCGQNGCFM